MDKTKRSYGPDLQLKILKIYKTFRYTVDIVWVRI